MKVVMRIHGIPPGIPFLPALAAGLRARLAAPEELARALILLPTRRSARALRAEFLPAGEGAVLLLVWRRRRERRCG